MLQWFIRFLDFAEFTEFLLHLGKTPIEFSFNFFRWIQWQFFCKKGYSSLQPPLRKKSKTNKIGNREDLKHNSCFSYSCSWEIYRIWELKLKKIIVSFVVVKSLFDFSTRWHWGSSYRETCVLRRRVPRSIGWRKTSRFVHFSTALFWRSCLYLETAVLRQNIKHFGSFIGLKPVFGPKFWEFKRHKTQNLILHEVRCKPYKVG